MIPAGRIDEALARREAFAGAFFDALKRMSVDRRGVTRPSYCEGEQRAHDHATMLADELGLVVHTDAAGNLMLVWPGTDPERPQWITGSHLDSVHEGGNFDGAAGVVAGLTAIAALKDAGFVPKRTLTVAAWRAEECSTWFVGRHGGHLGSRAALGLLDPRELESAIHITTNLPLGSMIRRAGFDPDRLLDGTPILPADTVAGYTEIHIEQGPVLERRGFPVGIVTGIRGCHRARNARVEGVYSHSGAVPREYRSDAVFALSDLIMRLDRDWDEFERAGRDLVVTVGKASTNPNVHAIVKVPGESDFAIDMRSQNRSVLDDLEARLRAHVSAIEKERRVCFTIDPVDRVVPAVMDEDCVRELRNIASACNIEALDIASGGGHDAADFFEVGVASSMIFVRNANGSHNPDEHMEIADFMEATRLLTHFLAARCG